MFYPSSFCSQPTNLQLLCLLRASRREGLQLFNRQHLRPHRVRRNRLQKVVLRVFRIKVYVYDFFAASHRSRAYTTFVIGIQLRFFKFGILPGIFKSPKPVLKGVLNLPYYPEHFPVWHVENSDKLGWV